jgi:hypothetical protein
MNVPFSLLWHASELDNFGASGGVLIVVVLGLEDNCPACREDTVVCTELIRLEEEAAKDGIDGQTLPIGEMHNTWRRRHVVICMLVEQVERAERGTGFCLARRRAMSYDFRIKSHHALERS